MKIEKHSQALTLIKHVWDKNETPAWNRLNAVMFDAVKLAIASHMHFDVGDFQYINEHMRTGYWLGDDGWERPYAIAVERGNVHFIKAFEEWQKRAPFFANDVKPGRNGSFRQRERLALNFQIGHTLKVTSINCAYVVVCKYKDYCHGKLIKRYKWTREDLARLFPAPKKAKAVKAEVQP